MIGPRKSFDHHNISCPTEIMIRAKKTDPVSQITIDQADILPPACTFSCGEKTESISNAKTPKLKFIASVVVTVSSLSCPPSLTTSSPYKR